MRAAQVLAKLLTKEAAIPDNGSATEARSMSGYSRRIIDRFFFFSSRRRHTRLQGDWSSDVCSSDLYSLRVRPLHQPQLACGLGDRGNVCCSNRLLGLILHVQNERPVASEQGHRNGEIGRASCRERV